MNYEKLPSKNYLHVKVKTEGLVLSSKYRYDTAKSKSLARSLSQLLNSADFLSYLLITISL
jgi:hypothetical protein